MKRTDKSVCGRCGYCCRNLYFLDRIRISFYSKSIMLSKRCKFLEGENKCIIHQNKPRVCRDWF